VRNAVREGISESDTDGKHQVRSEEFDRWYTKDKLELRNVETDRVNAKEK